MATLLLVRHGRTAANTGGTLAGWTPGIGLDPTGQAQAASLAERLRPLELAAAVASPLQRCQETAAAALAPAGPSGPRPALQTDDRLGECHYGDWTGRPLKELAKEPLWRVVQQHPSAVRFPGPDGESMPAMQHRAVEAVREYDAGVGEAHGPDALWVAFSHGDVIKAILAEALGMHLDSFQRIVVEPGSVSVIRYTPLRPFALRVNDVGGDLSGLNPPPKQARRTRSARTSNATAADALSDDVSDAASDAIVGGGDGGAPTHRDRAGVQATA
jgi:probable phosphomutase (TIGR03848 family)